MRSVPLARVAISGPFGIPPSRVLHRTPDWLLQPEQDYEIEGFYRGVCFPCGAVVIDGTLLVYYGGGDKYCAVASCSLEELVSHLRKCPA